MRPDTASPLAAALDLLAERGVRHLRRSGLRSGERTLETIEKLVRPLGFRVGTVMNTAADVPNRSANAFACRALMLRFPARISLTFDCEPNSSARSVCRN